MHFVQVQPSKDSYADTRQKCCKTLCDALFQPGTRRKYCCSDWEVFALVGAQKSRQSAKIDLRKNG